MLALAKRYAVSSNPEAVKRTCLKVLASCSRVWARLKRMSRTSAPQNLRVALDTAVGKIVLRHEAAVERCVHHRSDTHARTASIQAHARRVKHLLDVPLTYSFANSSTESSRFRMACWRYRTVPNAAIRY